MFELGHKRRLNAQLVSPAFFRKQPLRRLIRSSAEGQQQTKLRPGLLAGCGPFDPGYFCAKTSKRNAFTSSCAFFIAASL